MGIALGVTLAEFGLRIAEQLTQRNRLNLDSRYFITDARLGYRIAPNAPGHDANGFRNAAVPLRTDIIALGDSQTWGLNAERSDAWPQTLARASRRSIYSMGVLGYGPVQYWALMPQALDFSPRVVIIGIYLGNDLYDSYHVVYDGSLYEDLRAANPSSELVNDTIATRSQSERDELKNFEESFGRDNPAMWGLWLRQHTAIGRLLDRVGVSSSGRSARDEIDRHWAAEHPSQVVVYDGGVSTVLRVAYRFSALNLDDPRIADGLRITREVVRRMKVEADARRVHMLVLLIPTKETVFSNAVESRTGLDKNYGKLVRMENDARSAIISECASTGAEYADALPALTDALSRGQQVYPPNADSHPNPNGYAVIANVVEKRLEQLEW